MTMYLVNIPFPVQIYKKNFPVKVWVHYIYNAVYRFVAFGNHTVQETSAIF